MINRNEGGSVGSGSSCGGTSAPVVGDDVDGVDWLEGEGRGSAETTAVVGEVAA